MGGLFGGGGSSKPKEKKQQLNPPVDMSGSSIPGDDKIAQRKLDTVMKAQAAKAGQTLLGRGANEPKAGTAPKPETQRAYG